MHTVRVGLSILAILAITSLVAADGSSATQPSTRPTRPELVGSDEFKKRINEALDLLERKAPGHFLYLIERVSQIRESTRSGAHVWAKPSRIDLAKPTWDYSVTWVASALVHEAVHFEQWRRHKRTASTQPFLFGRESEIEANKVQLIVANLIGAPENEIEHLANADGNHFDLNNNGVLDWGDYFMRRW